MLFTLMALPVETCARVCPAVGLSAGAVEPKQPANKCTVLVQVNERMGPEFDHIDEWLAAPQPAPALNELSTS
jgi:hypothetical protein